MMEFCKAFNERTQSLVPGTPCPVNVFPPADRSKPFEFVVKTPTTSWLLKQAAELDKGATSPGIDTAGTITLEQIYEVAKVKKSDEALAHLELESILKSVMGTARSMGLDILDASS